MRRNMRWVPDRAIAMETWYNDSYQCFVTFERIGGRRWTHLSIARLDREPVHDWRDLQWIKSDVVGPEREAVELYPAESRLLDGANQYHLWVFPPGERLEVGFFGGRQVKDNFAVPGAKGKQRPIPEERLQPGDRFTPEEEEQARRFIQQEDAKSKLRQMLGQPSQQEEKP